MSIQVTVKIGKRVPKCRWRCVQFEFLSHFLCLEIESCIVVISMCLSQDKLTSRKWWRSWFLR